VQQAKVPDASSRKRVDPIEVALQGMSALDAEECGDGAVSPAGFDFACGSHKSEIMGSSFDRFGEDINFFVDRTGQAARLLACRK
jgi:hypothetical protein